MHRAGDAALSASAKIRLFVSVGTNIDREANLRSAMAALRARFGRLEVSPVYESAAQGFDGDPFYNLVVALQSDESATDVAAALKEIERAHGRRPRDAKFAPRTLDLDLLTYGDATLDVGRVHLPRGDILRYAFVLRPLADLAPEACHPVLGKSYQELWEGFAGPDELTPVALALD